MLSRAIEISRKFVETLDSYSPLTLITGTVAAVLTVQKAYSVYSNWDTRKIKNQLFDTTVKTALHLPVIGKKVQKELDGVKKELEAVKEDVDRKRLPWRPIVSLPEQGLTAEDILARFEFLESDPHKGRASGAIYAKYDDGLRTTLETVWGKTALTNPMHSAWPLINLMEAEVISMCQALMHGAKGAHGIMTHGGTTSVVEACFAYAREARRNGIEPPEVIVPDTAHIAFDKAAEYLHFRLIKIPVRRDTGAADVDAMENAISSRTCLLIGSAPSFMYGVMDPIVELGKVAQRYHLPLHVDACLGGFINAFAEDAGYPLPAFDFSVPGVSSLSLDTHKYGQTPKGTSVLLFRHGMKASPTHVHLDWVGGMYVTEGIDGSRSGADIATTNSVLCAKGKNTYVDETRAILKLQRELVRAIAEIDAIYVPFQPQSSVIGIKSLGDINILVVVNQMEERGWSVNILQTPDQKADGFHFCLTSVHAHQPNFQEDFIRDLTDAVTYAKANPQAVAKGNAKIYGKLEKGIPPFVQQDIGEGYVQAHNTIRL